MENDVGEEYDVFKIEQEYEYKEKTPKEGDNDYVPGFHKPIPKVLPRVGSFVPGSQINPRPNGSWFNRDENSFIKPKVLVIAPPCAGKSYYAKLGVWEDGDILLKDAWPKDTAEGPFWKVWSDEAQIALSKLMLESIEHLFSNVNPGKERIIAFAPRLEALYGLASFNQIGRACFIIVWVPSEEDLITNAKRGRNPNQPGLEHMAGLVSYSQSLKKMAREFGWGMSETFNGVIKIIRSHRKILRRF